MISESPTRYILSVSALAICLMLFLGGIFTTAFTVQGPSTEPMITLVAAGQARSLAGSYTIVDTVRKLFQQRDILLGSILFFFSIVFPVIKLTTLAILAGIRNADKRIRWLEKLDFLGKYSLTELFALSFFILVIVILPGNHTVTVQQGTWLFALAALLSMLVPELMKRTKKSVPNTTDQTEQGTGTPVISSTSGQPKKGRLLRRFVAGLLLTVTFVLLLAGLYLPVWIIPMPADVITGVVMSLDPGNEIGTAFSLLDSIHTLARTNLLIGAVFFLFLVVFPIVTLTCSWWLCCDLPTRKKQRIYKWLQRFRHGSMTSVAMLTLGIFTTKQFPGGFEFQLLPGLDCLILYTLLMLIIPWMIRSNAENKAL